MVKYSFSRDNDDEGTFVLAFDDNKKNQVGTDMCIAHLHVPDEAIRDNGWYLGDINVNKEYRHQGIATKLVDLMSDRLQSRPKGASSVFSDEGKSFFDAYNEDARFTELGNFKVKTNTTKQFSSMLGIATTMVDFKINNIDYAVVIHKKDMTKMDILGVGYFKKLKKLLPHKFTYSSVAFGINNNNIINFDITNRNEAFKVISMVYNILIEYLRENDIDVIGFTADEKRTKLYILLKPRLKNLGFEFYDGGKDDDGNNVFLFMRNRMNESININMLLNDYKEGIYNA